MLAAACTCPIPHVRRSSGSCRPGTLEVRPSELFSLWPWLRDFFPHLPCFPVYLIYACHLNTNLPYLVLRDVSFIFASTYIPHFFTYRVFQSTIFSTIRPHTTFHNLPHFPLFVNLPRLPICPIIWLPHLQSTLFGHPLHISTYSIFQSIAEVCLYFGFACHFTLPCSTLLLCLYSFPIAFLPTKLSCSICIPFRYLRN